MSMTSSAGAAPASDPQPPFPIPLPPQWSSPLWWASLINFLVQELVALGTLFHVSSWTSRLSGVTQGEIVMAAQALAVVGFVVYGWVHHQTVKAILQHNSALAGYRADTAYRLGVAEGRGLPRQVA